MADNRIFDGLEFAALDLPYNKVLRELDEEPRLVYGLNSFITLGGKLVKRPGTTQVDSNINTTLNRRIDRLWIYETLDNPPYVYLVASAYNSGTSKWELYWLRMDAGSPAWTAVTSYRDSNLSTRPHEAQVSRGMLYVKSYPAAGSTEKLGSIILDGTGGSITVRPWGLLGPTTPAKISGTIRRLSGNISSSATSFTLKAGTALPAAPFNIQIDYELITVTGYDGANNVTSCLRGAQGTTPAAHLDNALVLYRDWTSAAHPVAVNQFWEYSYAYETPTGQISNRAAAETNPDNMPSLTGPFINLIPKIIVQGNADTTNYPYIRIYRTTDGGGTLLKLDRIPNTGAGNITYEDKSLTSSSGTADPKPDKDLDTQDVAPTLNSNSPPPTVVSPKVVGTDAPQGTTPIASYSGRLWFGIGNTLFYSANEELNTGIPEESWPTGQFGNFYKFQYPILGVEGTTDALYVITTHMVYQITGSTKETFNARPLLNNIGGATGHSRSYTKYGDALVWVTNDFRIGILQNNDYRTISDPLGTDYLDLVKNENAQLTLTYWASLDREWLVLGAICPNQSKTRFWIYDISKSVDLKKDFWNTPWTIPATAVASGRARESQPERRLLFTPTNGTANILTRIATTPETTATDDIPGALSSAFDFVVRTSLFQVPPGDHVNILRRPGLLPIIYDFYLERTKFNADTDPTVYYYLDDLWINPIPTFPEDAARGGDTLGYKQLFYPVQSKGRRVSLEIQKTGLKEPFELQNFVILFNADIGSTNN